MCATTNRQNKPPSRKNHGDLTQCAERNVETRIWSMRSRHNTSKRLPELLGYAWVNGVRGFLSTPHVTLAGAEQRWGDGRLFFPLAEKCYETIRGCNCHISVGFKYQIMLQYY